MKIRLLIVMISMFGAIALPAATPDILVTQEGESLKVYNIDITSGDNVYYTLAEADDAPIQKILKTDVLVIKKGDGTVWNLNSSVVPSQSANTGKPYDTPEKTNATHRSTSPEILLHDLMSLSTKKDYGNMTQAELDELKSESEYDIFFDYSEALVNELSYENLLKHYKTESGIPIDVLLDQYEQTMVSNLNKAIKGYNFRLGSPKASNKFKIIVKFREITPDAKSFGYVVACHKESGNICFWKFTTRSGRWNNFENLLKEDFCTPYVEAPDRFSISVVPMAIEYATRAFRTKQKRFHLPIQK